LRCRVRPGAHHVGGIHGSAAGVLVATVDCWLGAWILDDGCMQSSPVEWSRLDSHSPRHSHRHLELVVWFSSYLALSCRTVALRACQAQPVTAFNPLIYCYTCMQWPSRPYSSSACTPNQLWVPSLFSPSPTSNGASEAAGPP
jgi:hypothetical protein